MGNQGPGQSQPRISPTDRFLEQDSSHRRAVQIALCRRALTHWLAYCSSGVELSYVESVTGTHQRIDPQLPVEALAFAAAGTDGDQIEWRYAEPLAALQDGDLVLPENIEYAFYAIFNLYMKLSGGRSIDDWLIVNQALAALGTDAPVTGMLSETIRWAELVGTDIAAGFEGGFP